MKNIYLGKVKNYVLIKKLGSGYSSNVYFCKNDKNQEFAIKIFKITFYKEEIINEIENLKAVRNNKVINIIDYGKDNLILTKNKKKFKIYFIVFEYIKNGEIYNYVKFKKFPPEIAIHYFKKLLEILIYFKQVKLSHLDLKLENILLNDNFELKIIDFGFSVINHNNTNISEFKGTKPYSSPENLEKINYNGFQNDLFSVGVILFILYTGNIPFISANKDCKYYKYIINYNYKEFWKIHESKNKISYPQEFKNLINCMLSYKIEDRLDIYEILNYSFIKNSFISDEEIYNFMSNRKTILYFIKNKSSIKLKYRSNYNKLSSSFRF